MTDARIHDTGYRPFDGERLPVHWAILELAKHGAQRVFGLKRKGKHKVLPFGITIVAFLPAVVFVGTAVMVEYDPAVDEVVPELGEYFGLIALLVLLFISLVAPEALCADRRTGMLGLYLASPLTRDTYVLGRFIGIFGVVLFVATGPQLLILLGLGVEGSGPENIGAYLADLLRILGAGIVIALTLTAVTMALSSLTPRRGAASALIVAVLFGAMTVVNGIIASSGAPDELAVLDIVLVTVSAGERIFGQAPDSDTGAEVLSAPIAIGAALIWSFLGLAFCRYRYQHIDVRQ